MRLHRNLSYAQVAVIYVLFGTIGALLFFMLAAVLADLVIPVLALFGVELPQPVRYLLFVTMAYILGALLFLRAFRGSSTVDTGKQAARFFFLSITLISILIGIGSVVAYFVWQQQPFFDLWGLDMLLPTLCAGVSLGFATLTFGYWLLSYRA